MIEVGKYNTLKVIRQASFGYFLDDGADGILLPTRFVPEGLKLDDEVEVFIYHDGEERLIATTQKPKGIAGDIVKLKAVNVTSHGAFLDNGLMKDLFVPKSQQLTDMRVHGEYLVKLFIDEKTGRLTATERIQQFLSNDELTVKVKDEVDLIVYRRTDLGYVCIINNLHTGLLHHNEIFRSIGVGDTFRGFIKNILPENKIDLVAGKPGYQRVEDEAGKIVRLLQENSGFLPYHDKSSPDDIYEMFAMSKKTFKMTVGALYKQRKISIEPAGIKLII